MPGKEEIMAGNDEYPPVSDLEEELVRMGWLVPVNPGEDEYERAVKEKDHV